MQIKRLSLLKLFAVLAFISLPAPWASAQTAIVPSRITATVDETRLTMLRGNTHPFARARYDRGPASAGFPMDAMLLVLKRSPDQQAALDKLLAEQQDQSSPNYHNWLTPAEFGQQFGPSDQDIQTITSWLQSRGFRVGNVPNGRTVIEFTGTAAQVQDAFHTSIHQYVVNGEDHFANSSDPSIPEALAPAVEGVRSLHNFYPKPMHHVIGVRGRPSAAAGTKSVNPDFTFPNGCTASTCNFALGPADFATIYNVLPLWNAGIDGTGVTIAVVGDSNIDPQDVTDFRSMFGLPAKPVVVTVPTSIPGCTDPGLQPSGDEIEAILDVEWAGAVARNANINLITCKSGTTFGGDLAALYIINTGTGLAPILSESFGDCEFDLGTAGNAMYNSFWSQAAAEGITVIVSSGDNGSAGCDFVAGSGPPVQPATAGLQVSGVASTPFNVAVGGTEFNDFTNPFTFWNNAGGNAAGTGGSAISYIPETTWNDTCTNSIIYTAFGLSSAAAACNNSTIQNDGFVTPTGSSGGRSSCTTFNGSNPANCTGGYAKPIWQTGPGVPSDGKRDIPDISLFAGDGLSGSFYIVCERDFPGTVSAACNLNVNNPNFLSVGGTSVSTQAFAGIMALIDQNTNSAQGNPNPTFYALAAEQSSSVCNSSGTTSTSCAFNDIADGSTNAVPCEAQATTSVPTVSPNCPVTSSGPIGVLTNPTTKLFGYIAGTGYDLATGLGSPNASALVTKWRPNFYISSSNPTVTVSKGGSGSLTLTVTAVNLTSGSIIVNGFQCPVLPSLATCSFTTNPATNPASVTLTPSSPTQAVTVVINTTASGTSPAWKWEGPAKWLPGGFVPLACVLFSGVILIGRSERQRRLGMAFALIAFGVGISIVGCSGGTNNGGGGGGNGGTPTGTTTAAVTATNGTVTTTMNFTLTVQ